MPSAGYVVIGTYKESASGVKLDRAARRKVLALAQRREIDVVLVTELSRWGRSTTDLLATLKELEARRVSLVAFNGMAFDLTTPRGRLTATLLARSAPAPASRSPKAASDWDANPSSGRSRSPVGADDPGIHRPGTQLPTGRARSRAEHERRRRHRQSEPHRVTLTLVGPQLLPFPIRAANSAILPVSWRDPGLGCGLCTTTGGADDLGRWLRPMIRVRPAQAKKPPRPEKTTAAAAAARTARLPSLSRFSKSARRWRPHRTAHRAATTQSLA